MTVQEQNFNSLSQKWIKDSIYDSQKLSPSLSRSLSVVNISNLQISDFVYALEQAFNIKIQWTANRVYLGDVTLYQFGETHNQKTHELINSTAVSLLSKHCDVVYEEIVNTRGILCGKSYRRRNTYSPGQMLDVRLLRSDVVFTGWDLAIAQQDEEVKKLNQELKFLFQEFVHLGEDLKHAPNQLKCLKNWFFEYLHTKKVSPLQNDLKEISEAIEELAEFDEFDEGLTDKLIAKEASIKEKAEECLELCLQLQSVSEIFNTIQQDIARINQVVTQLVHRYFSQRQRNFIDYLNVEWTFNPQHRFFLSGSFHLFATTSCKQKPALEPTLKKHLETSDESYFVMSPAFSNELEISSLTELTALQVSLQEFEDYIIVFKCLILDNTITHFKASIS